MQNNHFHIYTDGSSYPKVKVGAWAFLIVNEKQEVVTKSSGLVLEHATNNRMELQAIVEALEELLACDRVTVYADSEFALKVVQGKKMAHENPLDAMLLKRLENSKIKFQEITFEKVKAHSKHLFNTQVDKLARKTLRNSHIEHQQIIKEKFKV